MTRSSLLMIAALTLTLAAPPATAGGRSPAEESHAFGASLLRWQERWMQWALGSGTNPLLTDVCGEAIDGVFFLTAAAEPGVREVDCRIPPGTRLLGTPAAAIAWAPTDGQTREELLASRDSFLAAVAQVRATLDGRPLRLGEAPRSTDVYTVPLEPGNFIQTVDTGVTRHETQVASAGWFLRLTPLAPGRHELTFVLDVIDVGAFEITFHITVR